MLPETKRRRLLLKQERMTDKGALEATEGSTYQSEIGLSTEVSITKVPDATIRPSFSPVSIIKPHFVVIDLETTGLISRNNMPHITQIACLDAESKDTFSAYVLPKTQLDPNAERATGIVFDGSTLYVRGQRVAAIPIREALDNFLEWLKKFSDVVLVAHNGRVFDFRVLCIAVNKCNLQNTFRETVTAFVDSLSVMRRNVPKLPSYKQECLARHFSLPDYNAHNAVDDVIMLERIISAANFSESTLMKHSYSSDCHFQQEIFNAEKSKHIGSLHVLIGKGVMKTSLAENIAGSGLGLSHLKLIYDRDGEDGLSCVFSSKTSDGKPRVTATSKVLQNVIPKLCEFFAAT